MKIRSHKKNATLFYIYAENQAYFLKRLSFSELQLFTTLRGQKNEEKFYTRVAPCI